MIPKVPYEAIQENSTDLCGCQRDDCKKTAYQYADVSVPVKLKSDAEIGDVEIECCGEPVIRCCSGECANSCEVIITQKISIKIPVHYKVDACMGDSAISCGEEACCK